MSLLHDLNVALPQITRIGIANLADVAEHRTHRVNGLISHHIRVNSGDVVNAANGSLMGFAGTGASMTLEREGAHRQAVPQDRFHQKPAVDSSRRWMSLLGREFEFATRELPFSLIVD